MPALLRQSRSCVTIRGCVCVDNANCTLHSVSCARTCAKGRAKRTKTSKQLSGAMAPELLRRTAGWPGVARWDVAGPEIVSEAGRRYLGPPRTTGASCQCNFAQWRRESPIGGALASDAARRPARRQVLRPSCLRPSVRCATAGTSRQRGLKSWAMTPETELAKTRIAVPRHEHIRGSTLPRNQIVVHRGEREQTSG